MLAHAPYALCSWRCCMCSMSNEVPQLFDWDQVRNQPGDRWARAELNHGVVEFVAPTEYMVRPPQPAVYVFLVDVSHSAIQSGMVATATRTILENLDRIPNEDSRTKVAFIAFDVSLYFFSLPAGTTESSMLVVSDIEDVFLPKPTDLLVNLAESRPAIENLLGRLNDMFQENTIVGSALGPALQAAFKMMVSIHTFLLENQSLTPGPQVAHWWQDRDVVLQSPVTRHWCPQEPGGPEGSWNIKGALIFLGFGYNILTNPSTGVWSTPGCVALLQDVCD